MANANNAERSFRQFLRATFKARMAHDDEGHFVTVIKGKTAKTQIQNVDTVLASLYEQAKPVKETSRAVTFAYKQGKGKNGQEAEITVSLADRVLTMVSKH